MSFIADSADNAFHFRLFRKTGETNSKGNGNPAEECDIIRVQLPETEPESFDDDKLSIIEEGLTQSRIIKRVRHSAHSDPSVQTGTNITILSVVPEHPSKMLEIPGREEQDIHFALQGDVQPFVVNFIVHRKESEEMPLAYDGDLMSGQLMQCKFEDMNFDLLVTLSKVQVDEEDEEVNWPPHSVVLKRTGN
jgi:hypothetical protein